MDEVERAKVIPFGEFQDNPHWVVNRWWSAGERRELEEGVAEGWDVGDVNSLVAELGEAVTEFDLARSQLAECRFESRALSLGDVGSFQTFIGKRHLKAQVSGNEAPIPVYSANIFVPFGLVEETNVSTFGQASLLWGIDGNFYLRVIEPDASFATTDHCGVLRVLRDDVVLEYILCALTRMRDEVGFDRSFRASLTNIRRLDVEIPVDAAGQFDVEMQRTVADAFQRVQDCREKMQRLKSELDEQFGRLAKE